jgi:hypothetical protein
MSMWSEIVPETSANFNRMTQNIELQVRHLTNDYLSESCRLKIFLLLLQIVKI